MPATARQGAARRPLHFVKEVRMWMISGWFMQCRYTVSGDASTVRIPDWLWGALQLEVGDNGGILVLMPGGPNIKVEDDPAKIEIGDVVQVLQVMTNISDVTGDLPPQRTYRSIFDGPSTVY